MERTAALREAFELVEAVQGEDVPRALAALDAADDSDPDVRFVLQTARAVHAAVHGGRPDTDGLLAMAPDAACRAVALGLQALTAPDAVGLLSATSRAVALLDEPGLPGPQRCLALVINAAALNTLRLWELVDELYADAVADPDAARVARQAEAVAVNRVLIGLEHGLALLECGDEQGALVRLRAAADLVPGALEVGLRPLWRHDALAVADLVRALDGQQPDVPLSQHAAALTAEGDQEVLPLLLAGAAWVAWRRDGDPAPARGLEVGTSATSGARTFPTWVRAEVLAAEEPGPAVEAVLTRARLLSQELWTSRLAVLSAARAQVETERRRAEHERLARAVHTDPLTGLLNRRRFDDWLARPGTGTTALLLLDVDGFKGVNDRFGHAVGDEVLRRLGLLLRAAVRPGDLAVRQGGDELALVLRGEDLAPDAVLARASEVAQAVSCEDWSSVAPGLAVAVSVGAALADGQVTGPALYAAADAALYRAKRGTGSPVLEVLTR